MSIELRDYQKKIIEDTRIAFREHRGVMIRSSTGSGKTAINSFITKSALEKGGHIWFVVHREELIKQSSLAFLKAGVDHGFVASGWPFDPKKQVQICSIMTLINRLEKLPDPKMIVWDEAQYMAAGSWDKIYNRYPSAYHLGLTATPHRLDGKGFEKYFQHMVNGPSTRWLIDNKYLSDYRLFAPTNFDPSQLKTSMGDYDIKSIEEAITPKIVGDYFEVWQKNAFNKKTIVFAPSVNISKHITQTFLNNGVEAKHLDAETPKQERDQAIKDYASGKITLLSNVKLFTEGFDVPSIECVMLTRPTKSLALYLQMVGRALRPQEGKTHAIILDQVNSCIEHGLPDEDFEWSLKPREKKKSSKSGAEKISGVKVCTSCFSANLSFNLYCTNCGAEFDIKKRNGPEHVEGELSEVDKENFRKKAKAEQGKARTMQELTELGIKRGYKNPKAWAYMIMKSRGVKR